MAPQTWMVPRQKYDVIHYLREAYLKPHNPTQYAKVDDAYLAELPKGTSRSARRRSNVEPWVSDGLRPEPDEHLRGRRAGAEHRLQGHRRAARRRGRAACRAASSWALFDHDTLRFAAAWSGDGFIDWKGIHFNGQHQVHPKLVGDVHVANPVGPGWADPETGSFDDPRLDRPRRPALRPAAASSGRSSRAPTTTATRRSSSYTVGDAGVLEMAGAESDAETARSSSPARWKIGKSSRDLLARIAPDGSGRRRGR